MVSYFLLRAVASDVVILENAPEFYKMVEIKIKECKGLWIFI